MLPHATVWIGAHSSAAVVRPRLPLYPASHRHAVGDEDAVVPPVPEFEGHTAHATVTGFMPRDTCNTLIRTTRNRPTVPRLTQACRRRQMQSHRQCPSSKDTQHMQYRQTRCTAQRRKRCTSVLLRMPRCLSIRSDRSGSLRSRWIPCTAQQGKHTLIEPLAMEPLYPASHRHAVGACALAYPVPEFTGQTMQPADAGASLYLPATQFRHVSPPSYLPIGHALQMLSAVVISGKASVTGTTLHVAGSDATGSCVRRALRAQSHSVVLCKFRDRMARSGQTQNPPGRHPESCLHHIN